MIAFSRTIDDGGDVKKELLRRFARGWMIFIIALVCAIGGGVCRADTAIWEIDVDSDGILMDDDRALVRREAINNALEKSIISVVSTIVPAEKMSQYQEILHEKIYLKARGYIRDYRIAGETTTENGVYTVSIKAAVSADSVRRDLERLGLVIPADEVFPETMIIVAEKGRDDAVPLYRTQYTEPSFSEELLRKQFSERGFPVIDRQTVADAGGYFGDESETNRIAYLGRQCGAELIIVARSIVAPVTEEGQIVSHGLRAEVEGCAIVADDGSILTSARAESLSSAGDETEETEKSLIESAVAKMAADLIDEIRAKWKETQRRRQTITIAINGIERYADYARIKEVVEQDLAGVRAVRQYRMGKERAVLHVDVERPLLSIADDLGVRIFEGLTVQVTNIGTDRIDLHIVR